MGTTTIRVDRETHARLIALSRATGASLMETVQDAAEALRRQRFGEQVAVELAELHEDPKEWAAYLAEAEETSVGDGVGR